MTQIHRTLAVIAATLGCAAALADRQPAGDAAHLATEIDAERDHISALELAERIMHHDSTLRIFDLRSSAEFEQFHIPSASPITIRDLTNQSLPRDASIVLYSEGGAHAAQAWVLLRMRGYAKVYFLREGIYEWNARVFEPKLATDATPAERAEFERAAELSRYFGGVPRSGVSRSELPAGYWTAAPEAKPRTEKIRRRGC